jgi:periplasmic divalent cation tolerance protein
LCPKMPLRKGNRMEYRSIYFTVRDEAEARRIGQALVGEHLAACVNYFPVNSIFWWEGRVEESGENAVIAKTRVDLAERVILRIKELHSYQIPCTVVWMIEKGDPDCLAWIDEATGRSKSL